MVLSNGQLDLALPAVAPHQPAMGVLSAIVTSQQLQTRRDAPGVVTRVQAQSAKPVERVEIAKAKMLPRDHRPLLVRVTCKKLALIKPGCRLECCLCLSEFCTCQVLMRGLELFLENLDINPDVERRLNEVSLVLVDHHSGVADRGSQRLPSLPSCREAPAP